MGYKFPNLEAGKAVEVLDITFDPNTGFQGSLATSDPEGISEALVNEQEGRIVFSRITLVWDMLTRYKENMPKVRALPPPKQNEAFVCLWDEDEIWYRAQVRNVTSEKVTVVFVDFGNEAIIERNMWTQKARCPGGFLTERPMCTLPFYDSSYGSFFHSLPLEILV